MERVYVDNEELLEKHIKKILDQCVWINMVNNATTNNIMFSNKIDVSIKSKMIYFNRETGRIIKETDDVFDSVSKAYGDSSDEVLKNYLKHITADIFEAYVNNEASGIFQHHSLMRQKIFSHSWGIKTYLLETRPHLYV